MKFSFGPGQSLWMFVAHSVGIDDEWVRVFPHAMGPVRQRIAMGPVRDGIEADDGGRWAVRGIRAVRRREGQRGRPLDVLVEWEGEDSDGDLWEESWVSVTYLTADLRAEARRLEAELFGPRATQAGRTSRRANHRDDARRRQERERAAQQWRARLRDRAPPPSSA